MQTSSSTIYSSITDIKIRLALLGSIVYLLLQILTVQDVSFRCVNDTNLPTSAINSIQRNLKCNMTELMQRIDFDNLVNWTVDGISIANCDLLAIDRDFARKAIKDAAPNGLLLMGDSLTRYQYLNLVNFLEHGSWTTDPTNLKPSENENKFDGRWREFFQVTNQRLRGHEICDCYRENDMLENRYYINGDVKVTYLQVMGNKTQIKLHDTKMMNISSCYQSTCNQSLCQPGYCAPTLLPVDELGTILQPGVLSKMVASVAPSQVFFNCGHWWGAGVFARFGTQTLIDEVKRIRRDNPNIQIHWKTTTMARGKNPSETDFARFLMTSGGLDSYYDTWALTAPVAINFPKSMFWDNVHYEGPVYTGLNQALIAYLYSLPKN